MASFHPLWAGLSFQRNNKNLIAEVARMAPVSIPFGRVSVFKARAGPSLRPARPVGKFPSPLGGSQFSKLKGKYIGTTEWECVLFPSPLGGSQFSKRWVSRGLSNLWTT